MLDKGRVKILLADDEEDTITVLTDILEDEGYHIITTNNGEGALRLIEEEKPDLLILDLKIPGQDGESILKQLCGENPQTAIKVVILTGFNDFNVTKERIQKLYHSVVVDYVDKPIDIDQFSALVARHVGSLS